MLVKEFFRESVPSLPALFQYQSVISCSATTISTAIKYMHYSTRISSSFLTNNTVIEILIMILNYTVLESSVRPLQTALVNYNATLNFSYPRKIKCVKKKCSQYTILQVMSVSLTEEKMEGMSGTPNIKYSNRYPMMTPNNTKIPPSICRNNTT
jgi:hypothetical protein